MTAALRTACTLAVVAVAAGLVLPAAAQQTAGQEWRPFPVANVSAPLSLSQAAQAPALSAPPFQANLAATVKESWTDNVGLTSTNQRHDEISNISTDFNLAAKSPSTDLELGYNGGYDRYVNDTSLDGFHHNGIATVTSSLLDQRVILSAQGSVSEPNINPNSLVAAGDRASPVNRIRVFSYNAGPRIQEPLGDFATIQVSATRSQTVDQQINSVRTAQNTPAATPSIGDTTKDGAHAEMRNGISSARLLWDLSSDVSRSRLQNGDFDQQSYQLSAEYKFAPEFGLMVGTGYDRFRGIGVSTNTSGAFYDGGFHWNPSPATDLRLGGGWRDGKPYFFGLLTEQIGAFTVLRVSRDTKVTSDALNTFQSLESAEPNVRGGGFIDPLSGLTAAPASSSFQLSNAVYRLTTNQASLTRGGDRDSVSLSAQVSSQDVLSNPASNLSVLTGAPLAQQNTSASANLQWSHQLSRYMTASLSGGLSAVIASSLPTGKTKRAQASADFAYTLSDTTSIVAQYAFSDSLVPSGANIVSAFGSTSGRIRDDLVFVALKRKF